MDTLPEHILVDIFKMLDKKSLQSASTVCLSWHQLITSSSFISRKHWSCFNMTNARKLSASIKDLDSIPYKFILFVSTSNQNQYLLNKSVKVLKEHSSRIEEIAFSYVSVNTLTKIIGALNCDKITLLSIYCFDEQQLTDDMAVHLPHLEDLDIFNGSRILRMIKSHKIKNLSMHITSDYNPSVQDINRFLQTCPDLEILSFKNFFPAIETEAMRFRLKFLSIDNLTFNTKTLSHQEMDCLKNLIEMCCESLEAFVITDYNGIDKIFKFMMTKVKKLTKLSYLNFNSIQVEDDFPVNQTLKKICCTFDHDSNNDHSIMMKLIKSCPSLDVLHLNHCHYEDVTYLIHAAASNLKNLKELAIYRPSGLFANYYPKMMNLQTLSIAEISSQKDIKPFMNLLMAAPKLKTLKIDKWAGNRLPYLSKLNLKKVLRSCKELDEIYIGGNFVLPKYFVDGLLEAKSNVRSLVIETSHVDLVRENGQRLLKSKIQCTAYPKILPMEGLDECLDFDSSDDDDSEILDVSDYELQSQDEELWMDMSGDSFMNMNIDIDSEEEQVHGVEEDEEVIENDSDSDRELILDSNDVNEEIEDRFDEMGRRRSKRLKRD